MSKSSSSFLSLPTIIFLVVMYNVIFDDDDDKKDVEVEVDNKPAISEGVKENLNDAKEGLKDAYDSAKEAFNQAKGEIFDESDVDMSDGAISERSEEEVTQDVVIPPEEKEEKEDDGLEALDDNPKDDPLSKSL